MLEVKVSVYPCCFVSRVNINDIEWMKREVNIDAKVVFIFKKCF